jgi:hypothetical protein
MTNEAVLRPHPDFRFEPREALFDRGAISSPDLLAVLGEDAGRPLIAGGSYLTRSQAEQVV